MRQIFAEMIALPDSASDLIARCGTVMVLAGRTISLEISGSSVTGKCMGLGADGGLLVCSAGETRSYLVGSVVAIEPPLSC